MDGDGFSWRSTRIGAGSSFPVRRKDFDAAVTNLPVRRLHSVHRGTGSWPGGDFFWAVGVPEPAGIDYADFVPLATAVWQGIDFSSEISPALTADVSFFAVPSLRRAELREHLLRDGLPRLLGWIRAIEDGPETARTERRRTALFLHRGRVEQAE